MFAAGDQCCSKPTKPTMRGTHPFFFVEKHITNARSHYRRLAVDGNIPPLRDTHMLTLGFELWWVKSTTILLTTQPQIGSPIFYII
jgi:hypothetical protein